MRQRHPILYLPIEFRMREFDGKVLLAATLASRGYYVVIGQQWMLYSNIQILPPGAILFKNFNRIHHPAMIHARECGHRIIILEEELLGQIKEKAIASFHTEGLFHIPELILSNGKFECDQLQMMSNKCVRVEVTGNPRIDLLKTPFRPFFQSDIEEIKRSHGDFVLVNTNFSIVNSIW